MAKWEPKSDIPATDWAKMAAYIDGEGSIGIRLRKAGPRNKADRHVITVVLCNSDPRLITWAQDLFCVGSLSIRKIWNPDAPGRIKSRRPSYIWEVQAKRAEWLLKNCLPYFTIKVEQARICLELSSTMSNVWNRVPPEVFIKRQELKQQLHTLKATVIPFHRAS